MDQHNESPGPPPESAAAEKYRSLSSKRLWVLGLWILLVLIIGVFAGCNVFSID